MPALGGGGRQIDERMQADATLNYSKIVERYAHLCERPEVRLRFFRNTLARQAASRERWGRKLRRVPFLRKSRLSERLLTLSLYRLIFEELKNVLPAGVSPRALLRRNEAPLAARLFFFGYRLRYAFYAVGVVAAAGLAFGLYIIGARAVRHFDRGAALANSPAQGRTTRGTGGGIADIARAGVAYLPDYKPEKVWLVEGAEGSERYSNGARIITGYETDNHARGYYVFAKGTQTPIGEARREPAGIVYHTSENDLLTFTSDNSDSIEAASRDLLNFVRRHKSYNYLIDRFGQIYRVVRDNDAANHAGHSVWADREGVYVGLNESFLGVCFETRAEVSNGVEQLTEAQLIAGRQLTQILRSRYGIDDANCVTHGLVSISPGSMRVSHHHDWARDFPFAAMGLSDKYAVPTPSISEFGFAFDAEIERLLGGYVWPGARPAEEEFARRAREAGTTPEELRRQTRARYREQMAAQRGARAGAEEGGAQLSRGDEAPDAGAQEGF